MTAIQDLPAAWFTQFDAEALEDKTGVSAALATVDADGWPHLAFLSAGEVVARGQRLALALWPNSATQGDLRRNGRAALYAAADGAVWETRLTCSAVEDVAPGSGLSLFRGEMVEVRRHKAPYAVTEGLVDFRLTNVGESVARWNQQTSILLQLLS